MQHNSRGGLCRAILRRGITRRRLLVPPLPRLPRRALQHERTIVEVCSLPRTVDHDIRLRERRHGVVEDAIEGEGAHEKPRDIAVARGRVLPPKRCDEDRNGTVLAEPEEIRSLSRTGSWRKAGRGLCEWQIRSCSTARSA